MGSNHKNGANHKGSRASRKKKSVKAVKAKKDIVNTELEEPKIIPQIVENLEVQDESAIILEETEVLEPLPDLEETEVLEPLLDLEETETLETLPVMEELKSSENLKPIKLPKTLNGFTSKRLLSCACLLVLFSIGYNALILPYKDASFAGPHIKTEVSTSSVTEITPAETITVETTTEVTITAVASTKPAKAVTKPYTAKPKAVYVAPPKKKVILDVPHVSQNPTYPTGCESGSAAMLLKYYGYNVSVDTLIKAIPRENLYKEQLADGTWRTYGPSIYEKFVGDPTCTYTSETPGYGAFSPVVTKAINKVIAAQGGSHIAKNITGSSVETLFSYIDSGHPVIIWSTSGMKIPTMVNCWYIKTSSGDQYFEYPRGTHVTVLKGYDSKKIYIEDPWTAGQYTKAYYIDKFAVAYKLLGCQAIVMVDRAPGETLVEPTTTTTKPTTTTTKSTTTSTKPDSSEKVTDEDGNEVTTADKETTTKVEEESGTVADTGKTEATNDSGE